MTTTTTAINIWVAQFLRCRFDAVQMFQLVDGGGGGGVGADGSECTLRSGTPKAGAKSQILCTQHRTVRSPLYFSIRVI